MKKGITVSDIKIKHENSLKNLVLEKILETFEIFKKVFLENPKNFSLAIIKSYNNFTIMPSVSETLIRTYQYN